MNMIVDNDDVNGDYCYTNSYAGYVIKNNNIIDYTSKRDEFSTNIYLTGNNGLPDDADIDDRSPASAFNNYVNIEYKNVHPNLQINGNIYTSRNSSVSTLTSTYVKSTNEEGC